ncbi:MAG: GGDEF domain-containing protein [Lachnospiraceae bacterium]
MNTSELFTFQPTHLSIMQNFLTVASTLLIMFLYNVKINQIYGKRNQRRYALAYGLFFVVMLLISIFVISIWLKMASLFLFYILFQYLCTHRPAFYSFFEIAYFNFIDILSNIITAVIMLGVVRSAYGEFNVKLTATIIGTLIYMVTLFTLMLLFHKSIGQSVYRFRNYIWEKQRPAAKIVIGYLIMLLVWVSIGYGFMGYYMYGHHTEIDLPFFWAVAAAIIFIIGSIMILTSMEQKRKYDDLKFKSSTDEMTGAMNRKFGMLYLQEQLKKDTGFVISYIDINHLKNINDQLGHSIGDQMIRFLVHTINNHLMQEDVLIRLGGDEFLVVCPEADPKVVKQQLNNALIDLDAKKPEVFKDYPLTFSFGLAEYNPKEKDFDLTCLIAKADQQMYLQKRDYKESLKEAL